ncbi:MAG: flagellar biosynthesis protein FlhF [Deltaproteobacteria bacterium]|jgi:flagellar biosynthesis protein FlhF|nr:flagellar biosynthesis protein FlhF [Deltaproteobacteria bacterium]MBT4525056.1 flagellar biosynthesis protein FlhF [Deltaproteobacteria bacterium]
MQVKKYIVANMQEAIKMIKEDLGNNAIIISTKKIRKGSGAFGLFGTPALEVTAAKDEGAKRKTPSTYGNLAPVNGKSEYQKELSDNSPQYPRIKATGDRKSYDTIKDDINELKDIVLDLRRGVRREINDEATVNHLRYELAELKNLVNNLVAQSGELRDDDLHENLIAIYQQLCFNGIEEKFARRLMKEVKKKIPKEEIDNYSYVKVFVARMFMQVLHVDQNPIDNFSNLGPKVLTFLGPTGVGKTTTIAKIAGSQKIENPDLKIGLITIDTFRIAAVQQLQEYARIIKIPIRVVNDLTQLDHVLNEFKNKDLVLIDTAGRSQRDEMQMAELRDFLHDRDEFHNLLVISSTTKDGDLVEITKRFSTVKLDGVIFTKLDESTSYGSIFNHAIRFKLPLAYLTTGQNVPEDLESASRERLVDILMNISGELS